MQASADRRKKNEVLKRKQDKGRKGDKGQVKGGLASARLREKQRREEVRR
jgi:hypothetical protein